MRRRDIIAVLTQEEKSVLVTNAFNLLCNLKVFEDTKGLVAQLKRLLEQLYQEESEACFNKISGGYNSPTNLDCVEYCVAYKQIADILYFEDGKLSNGLSEIWLSSWTPSEAAKKELDTKNAIFRQDYEKRQNGVAVTDAVIADIKRQEKIFKNSLLQRRRLFLKYQMCKYLNKKFTVPKCFSGQTLPLWKLVEQLKETVFSFDEEQQKHIAKAIDPVINALSQLFYVHEFCTRISLITFPTEGDIKEAYRQKTLELYDDNIRDHNGWVQHIRFWHESYFSIQEDPDIKDKALNHHIANLVNVVYTLQRYIDTHEDDIRDFLLLLGIAKPKEE